MISNDITKSLKSTLIDPAKKSPKQISDIILSLNSSSVEIDALKRCHQILVQCTPDELVLKIENDINYLSNSIPNPILHRVIHPLEVIANRRDTSAGTQAFAFDCLAVIFVRLYRLFANHDINNIEKYLKSAIQIITEKQIWNILIACFENCDFPSSALHQKTKICIDSAINLRILLGIISPSDFLPKDQFFSTLRKYSLNLNRWKRSTFTSLSTVMGYVNVDDILNDDPTFIQNCLNKLVNTEIGPAASRLVVQLLQKKKQEMKELDHTWIALWLDPITHIIVGDAVFARKKVCDFILPALVQMIPNALDLVLNRMTQEPFKSSNFRVNAEIAVLKTVKSLNLNIDPITSKHEKIIENSIHHIDSSVRLDALRYICESKKGTNIVTSQELQFVKTFIIENSCITLPDFRMHMSSILSKLISRLITTSYAAKRDLKRFHTMPYLDEQEITAVKISEQVIIHNQVFLTWFFEYLFENLFPGANYARCDTVLRILPHIIFSGLDKRLNLINLPTIHKDKLGDQILELPFTLDIFNESFSKRLVDVILNPYDDIREDAYNLLLLFPDPLPGFTTSKSILELFNRAQTLLLNNRSNEADAGAMTIKLLYRKLLRQNNFAIDIYHNSPPTIRISDEFSPFSSIEFIMNLVKFAHHQILNAKKNMFWAAQNHPLHGTLRCIHLISQDLTYQYKSTQDRDAWCEILQKQINLIEDCWELTREVICNDSPEGNIPVMMNEMYEKNTIGDQLPDGSTLVNGSETGIKSQIIASFAWRVIKEASALLGSLSSRAPIIHKKNNENNENINEFGLITIQQLEKNGQLFQDWLTKIRHRGAFSSIAPGFSQICVRLFTESEFSYLPKRWLKLNLDAIKEKGISLTRRSAGIPICITSILSSASVMEVNDLVQFTMDYLLEICQEPVKSYKSVHDLPQVHALNIIRMLFIESKLRRSILPYLEKSFIIATNNISSAYWPIRNSSLMLFAALLDRALGTKRSKDDFAAINKSMNAVEFFNKYPRLLPFFSKHLREAVSHLLDSKKDGTEAHHRLYPILILLSRMKLNTSSSGNGVTNELCDLVMSCGKSSIFQIRQMSAAALIPLLSTQDMRRTLLKLMSGLETSLQNEIHGRLTQFSWVLKVYLGDLSNDEQVKEVELMLKILISKHQYLVTNPCKVNSAFYLKLIKWLIERSSNYDSDLCKTIFTFCQDQACKFGKRQPSRDDYLIRCAITELLVYAVAKNITPAECLMSLLDDPCYEVQLAVLENMNETILSKSPILTQKIYDIVFSIEFHAKCRQMAITVFLNSKTCKSNNINEEMAWKVLNDIQTVRNIALRDSLVILLGALVSHIQSPKLFNAWVDQVERYSHEDQMTMSREAAVKSIFEARQGLFKRKSSSVMLRLIFVLLFLLVDDEQEIRQQTSLIVSSVLNEGFPTNQSRSFILLWNYLRTMYRNDSKFHERILDLALSKTIINDIEKHLDVSRILFEAERSNLYIENVKITQSAYESLNDIYSELNLNFKSIFEKRTRDGILKIDALVKANCISLNGLAGNPGLYSCCLQLKQAAILIGFDWSFGHSL